MSDPNTGKLLRNGVQKGTVTTLNDGWSIALNGTYEREYFDIQGVSQSGMIARISLAQERDASHKSVTLLVPLNGRFVADQPYTIVKISADAVTFEEQASTDPTRPVMPWNAVEQGSQTILSHRTFLTVQEVFEGDYTAPDGQSQRGIVARIILENKSDSGASNNAQTLEIPVGGVLTVDNQPYTVTAITLPTGDLRGWLAIDRPAQ